VWFLAAYRRTHSPSRLAWSEGRQPLDVVSYSSYEPGELSQWLCYDDSTINILMLINIIVLQVPIFSVRTLADCPCCTSRLVFPDGPRTSTSNSLSVHVTGARPARWRTLQSRRQRHDGKIDEPTVEDYREPSTTYVLRLLIYCLLTH